MKIKKIIYPILLIIWMLVIFLFSNQNGVSSQATSDGFMSNILSVMTDITNQEITEENKLNIISGTSFIIRKTAHFTIYFILGILTYLTLSTYQVTKSLLYSIIFCIVYAVSDEVHQLFLEGRAFKLFDIFIDGCGSTFGVLFLVYKEKMLINVKKFLHFS